MQCPFDKVHMIRESRMGRHLSKCEKQNLHIKLERCPFNALHRVPQPELSYHASECPDRGAADRIVYVERTTKHTGPDPTESTASCVTSEWELDLQTGCLSYDPMKKVAKEKMFHVIPQGLTKSERKAYSEEKRKEFTENNGGDQDDESVKSFSTISTITSGSNRGSSKLPPGMNQTTFAEINSKFNDVASVSGISENASSVSGASFARPLRQPKIAFNNGTGRGRSIRKQRNDAPPGGLQCDGRQSAEPWQGHRALGR